MDNTNGISINEVIDMPEPIIVERNGQKYTQEPPIKMDGYTIINLHPVLDPEERERRERILYRKVYKLLEAAQ